MQICKNSNKIDLSIKLKHSCTAQDQSLTHHNCLQQQCSREYVVPGIPEHPSGLESRVRLRAQGNTSFSVSRHPVNWGAYRGRFPVVSYHTSLVLLLLFFWSYHHHAGLLEIKTWCYEAKTWHTLRYMTETFSTTCAARFGGWWLSILRISALAAGSRRPGLDSWLLGSPHNITFRVENRCELLVFIAQR